ncbi:MAG TPA: multiheme c-type cytochrome [Acidobacteriota bacterium]|nr:multiheme c-type cytochrome [Acidobacteriota bacterium]HQM64535.1 multiheme c-type cytochrome [Acidobacteriota bacterium]
MRRETLVVIAVVILSVFALSQAPAPSAAAGKCLTCHKEKTPGLYQQWYGSAHALHKVTCLDCHRAESGDADGFVHYDARIATLVTPTDCGRCHKREAAEVGASYHATAGLILESQDAYLAHVLAGAPVAILGCESCHGAKVKLDPGSPNRLHKESWPNSGIGRINPDGSKGACNACHPRHAFSRTQARQPEACGKCHLGPDHPQKEIYDESKHGNTYYTHVEAMNLKADRWVVGEDYSAAPTCATCHMAASTRAKATHDVGQRIYWTLRPPVSTAKDDAGPRRVAMKNVCAACHGQVFVDGHFYQYDAAVRLYNDKFARPATEIMALATKNKLLERPSSFGNDIEWIYWELWHHEGRRARHGASMMGPDYTWWHGFYEVAKHFYFELIPEARRYNNPEVNAYIDRLLRDDPMHRWVNERTDGLKKQIRSGELQNIYRRFFAAGK